MDYLVNKTFDEVKVGDTASLTRILTKQDIDIFAVMSGDINPAHVDAEYAKDDIFHHIVAHGIWTGTLISTILGTELPGPGTIYLSQTLEFKRPVAVGDKITAEVKVIKKFVKKPILLLECICLNQHAKEVVTGRAKVLAPTEKVKWKKIKLPKIILKDEE